MLFAAVVRTARLPRPIAYVMVLAAVAHAGQGWLSGTQGFSHSHTFGIIGAEVLNAVWMTSLVVVAWRMPVSEPAPPRGQGTVA